MRRVARALKWTALVLLLAAGVLVLEGVLRSLGARMTREFEAEQKTSLERRDCVTILALGESTTGGVWCDPKDSYPRQLERLLTRRYGRPVCGFIPMHIGQNTSQMYNRFDRYVATIKPRLVIFMCGANNTWSLDESQIGRFIDLANPDFWWLRLRVILDRSRVFKLARMAKYDFYAWRNLAKEDLSGQAEYTPWPPPDENLRFGSRNRAAFLEMWRYEVGHMIDSARAHGASVVLMTYPNYAFPAPSDFVDLAAAKDVPLVRNDLMFKPLLTPGVADTFFFADRGHPRAVGYAMIAAELDRLIEEKDLLGLGPAATASNPP